MATDYTDLFRYLEHTEQRIQTFFRDSKILPLLHISDIYDGVLSYLQRPAKRLRPAVLLMACGCIGGEERESIAIPAAAGVELFHTWTLVHDDIIDNDALRRGSPTVHEAMKARAFATLTNDAQLADDYGRDLAILAGDVQHGWSITAFIDCMQEAGIDPLVILHIIKHLETHVIGMLVNGEVLDIQYGMRDLDDMNDIDEENIVHMLWLKTGVLYEFAGLAGALIGKNSVNFDDEQVVALKNFTANCGTAFQLHDDIIGIIGNEKELGKPVGSDIREGKKTVIVHEALKNASQSERHQILSVLGNKHASQNDISDVTQLFEKLGGIARTKALADHYTNMALPYLNAFPSSKYKELLILWADYMINRTY